MMTVYDTYMNYHLKDTLRETTAEIMYWYGEKEMKCVKKSAELVCALVPKGESYEAKGYGHGYLSVYLPKEWLTLATAFFERKEE